MALVDPSDNDAFRDNEPSVSLVEHGGETVSWTKRVESNFGYEHPSRWTAKR